ncbi:MAG: ATP-grasp domain-containing protein, partial [Bacteroidetes bacterium]|nr:ATP-grasp domain-containing protein [Bacteroidota bacterium]
YGLLAENADFSAICKESDIKFIGPSPDMINAMGNKSFAKETMKKNGVPVIPGSDGVIESIKEGKSLAAEIGYPVIIKASAGGGGKGMRIAWKENEFENAFNTAKSEAAISFGKDDVYVEKFIENPRHIEIQIMGDMYGNAHHYGERDCSIQRRHQKLLEESPSPAIDEVTRNKMGEAALLGVKAVNYEGAGTFEFLLDKNKDFYFMEMNTRIQVEHPVTETVYGVDLIRQQILVASGEKIETLPRKPIGHSIEFRINAEDPSADFRPSPGLIQSLHFPGGYGIRIDSHIYHGYTIPPYYDSLIAKLIVWGKNREHAIMRGRRALEEFTVEGINTTIPFHLKILEDEKFLSGNFDTGFMDDFKYE